MAKIPDPHSSIQYQIDCAHEARKERPRPHMGVSQIGHKCERWLWLSFRWAVIPTFSGRILRLFRRGHNEEAQIISDLRAIDIDIHSTGGSQARVSFGSHVSGSIDGIIKSGVPGALLKKHIAEFKTHSKKSFDDVEKNGVEKSKPIHYVQMQAYMLGMDIDRALYLAVCKDDDRIYTERVRLDRSVALKYVERAKTIALSDRMPAPLSTDETWFECRFCDAHEFCHKTKLTKEVNCRTCAHSTAKDDSTWFCELHQDSIPTDFQHDGCDSHVLHPDLVPWDKKDAGNDEEAIYIIDGNHVLNGASGFKSTEILANPSACASGDKYIEQIRSEFGASIVPDSILQGDQ